MARGFGAKERFQLSAQQKAEIRSWIKIKDKVEKMPAEKRMALFEPKEEASTQSDVANQIAAYKAGTSPSMTDRTYAELREKHVNDKREIYYEFDKDGRMVFAARGNETSIVIPAIGPPLEHKPLGGKSWHNHPAVGNNIFGYPPSMHDLQTAWTRGHSEMVVDSVEGTYRITFPKRVPVTMPGEYDDVWNAVFDNHIKQEGPVSAGNRVANRLLVLTLNEALAKKLSEYGVKYEFTPAPDFMS